MLSNTFSLLSKISMVNLQAFQTQCNLLTPMWALSNSTEWLKLHSRWARIQIPFKQELHFTIKYPLQAFSNIKSSIHPINSNSLSSFKICLLKIVAGWQALPWFSSRDSNQTKINLIFELSNSKRLEAIFRPSYGGLPRTCPMKVPWQLASLLAM